MNDYEKFKQSGLSRLVVSGKAQLTLVAPPPITTYNAPPVLKRQTLRKGGPAPKRQVRDDEKKIVVIRGWFLKFTTIKHNGYVIGRFQPNDGNSLYIVKGNLPVIDVFYNYQLLCKQWFSHGTICNDIISLHSTAEFSCLSVLPVPGTSFVKLLMEMGKYSKEEAQKIAYQIYTPIASPNDFGSKHRLLISKVILQFEYICKFEGEEWFIKLKEKWSPLLYMGFPRLLELGWNLAKLTKLNPAEISLLSLDVAENPWKYLIDDRNEYALPAIPENKIPTLNRLFGTRISAFDVACIQFYKKIGKFVQEKKKIALNQMEYEDVMKLCHFPPFFVNGILTKPTIGCVKQCRQLMTVVYEQNTFIKEPRFYRNHELEALRAIRAPLTRIMRQSVRSIRPPSKKELERSALLWQKIRLNKKQKECYNRLGKYNVMMILGGPGTGKSTLLTLLATRYPNSLVGIFAPYGTIADKLSDRFGVEVTTLAMAIDQVRKQNTNSLRYLQLEVAIIDELSLVDLVTFRKFLEALPRLKVLIIAGDECQMVSIGACPIIYGLLKKWDNTPFVISLTKIYRATNPILLDNLTALRVGNYQIQYSTDIESSHPFILLNRIKIPKEFRKAKSDAARLARVSILKKDLEPIYRYYEEREPEIFDRTMIITQRVKDVRELNHAWWCLKYNQSIDVIYPEYEFRVGETVIFTGDNMNNPNVMRPQHLRTTSVKHKSTAIIEEIWDFQPFIEANENPYARATSIETTDTPKEYHMERVIKFSNGHQINLKEYPLSNLQRGYAATTSSVQSLQCRLLIYYVQPGKKFYLTREEFYTGCSRTEFRVIVINKFKDEGLHKSDIARIMANPAKRECDILPLYLPAFEDKDDFVEASANPFEAPIERQLSLTEMETMSKHNLFGDFFSEMEPSHLDGQVILDENAQFN